MFNCYTHKKGNGNTYIKYELPIDAHIKIEIVDILGTVVKILHNKNTTAGYHSLNWDGTNLNGTKSASGIYFINLKMNKTQLTYDKFQGLVTQGCETIPVYKRILADLLTPVAAWVHLSQKAEYAFLLESVEKGNQYSRYS